VPRIQSQKSFTFSFLVRNCETWASFYRLPFGSELGWSLGNGNWDDPNKNARHEQVDGAAQSYSYDFGHVNGEGQRVRAARGGRVAFVNSTQSINTVQQPNAPGARGEGNIVVLRHLDGTASAYAHLQQGKVFVEEGEYLSRGRVIALSGNTVLADLGAGRKKTY
jgi:murein DD-endopeptidase MepM/ murein hydrolase activator NlpD